MTTQPVKVTNNRKWLMITAGVLVAALIALIAVSASKGDSKNGGTLAGVDDVTAELSGIPQSGLVIGKADAPVTITEYVDMQCPICAAASQSIVPVLMSKYVKTGTAKLQLQPIAFLGPDSDKGAKALIAAGEQNKAGEFAGIMFRNQGVEKTGWMKDSVVDQVATAAKIDTGKLNDARKSDATKKVFDAIAAAAQKDNVSGTPTFIIRGAKGQYTIRQNENQGEFAQAIAAVQ